MERKHYVRINPGLQLVEKAGLLAKAREQEQDHAYLSPEQVPNSRRGASPLPHLRLLHLPATAAITSVLL